MSNNKSNFKENGYCIFSNVFSEKEIDLVINELYKIRDKKKNFSTLNSLNVWLKNYFFNKPKM